MQRSAPAVLASFSDEELAEDHLLCLLCRAPATARLPFDLAEGATLEGRFEQLRKLRLCAACAQRKAAADAHGKPLVALAFAAPLALVTVTCFTLPLPSAWMPMALFALGALASVAILRRVRRARADRAVAVVLGGTEDRLELRIRPPEVDAGASAGPYRGAGSPRSGGPVAPAVQRNDGLMALLTFALFASAPAAAWLYLQACPVVMIDNSGMPAEVSIDGRALERIPGGESSVLRLRAGPHRIAVKGARGADSETLVLVDWGVSSLFSVQPGGCYRRFGQYSRGWESWHPAETDERWFPIADETQVIRIPCGDMPPRPKLRN